MMFISDSYGVVKAYRNKKGDEPFSERYVGEMFQKGGVWFSKLKGETEYREESSYSDAKKRIECEQH